jgi:NADH-quinone oxidoreductase subunit L
VIIALHHEQDMRRMGGLRRWMPITYWTAIVGSLALAGVPPFAGFFSKDAIIEAVHHSHLPGAGIAHAAVLGGVFVTAFYSFRLIFMTFHGEPRMDEHTREHLHETPWVVTGPLIALAIPSVIIGMLYVGPMLFGGYWGDSIRVLPEHDVLAEMGESFHGVGAMILHGLTAAPFWLALAGIAAAWLFYIVRPDLPGKVSRALALPYRILVNKYGVDELYQAVFAGGGRAVGRLFWRVGDVAVIDGLVVNGSARLIGWCATMMRQMQSGFVYHYAFAMIIGLVGLMSWFLWS